MTPHSALFRALYLGSALLTVAACSGPTALDWDLRGPGAGLDTTDAARQATQARPGADARGVISYPGYQVAVARRGDTVATVAGRVGLGAEELARYNAITPQTELRSGEVLALPRRVTEPASGVIGGATAGAVTGGLIGSAAPAPVDVTTIATTALDRVGPSAPAPVASKPAGAEPTRHRVARGETAFSIARTYNVPAKALADWNGLGPDLAVREGQYLIIPVAAPGAAPAAADRVPFEVVTEPGEGSPTPVPPSAAKPLPAEKTTPAAKPAASTPASPDLGAQRTAASASRFAMPVDGKIIRGYAKKKNEGIDIAASAGTPVKAAAAGTVAAITTDTGQVPIVVIRHDGGLLTVYAGLDAIKVTKGAAVKRGQAIGVVRAANPAFLHFEVRQGVESVDPMKYLQ